MRNLSILLTLLLATFPAVSETIRLEADRDAVLIEDDAGAYANGSGPALHVGRNAQAANAVRRALVRFDVASALPEQAIVEAVALTLHMTPSNPAPRTLRLHRVLADWGEGPAYSEGGGGAPATAGDVTWLFSFFDVERWVRPGGQFLGRPSASLRVSAAGAHTWTGRLLAADVRVWSAVPQRNFGWVLLGEEAAVQSAKSFASREHPDASLRPVLEITYRLPGPRTHAGPAEIAPDR